MVHMRRRFGDVLMSAGAVLGLILTLAALDARVREYLTLRLSAGTTSAQVADAGTTVRDLAGVVFVAVRDQSIEHAPLVLFVLAATVLMLFMLRT
jgi:hypothetical protein